MDALNCMRESPMCNRAAAWTEKHCAKGFILASSSEFSRGRKAKPVGFVPADWGAGLIARV